MGLVPSQEARELASSLPIRWKHTEKRAVSSLGRGPSPDSTMLTPQSRTSSLQNHEKSISVVSYPLYCVGGKGLKHVSPP